MSRLALLPVLVFVHPLTGSQMVPPALSTDGLGIDHTHLAVIVKTSDAQSVETGEYDAKQRRIPAVNIIHITFRAGVAVMSVPEFARVKATIDALTPRVSRPTAWRGQRVFIREPLATPFRRRSGPRLAGLH